MRAEAQHIEDDRETLRFAIGGLYAGYAERLRMFAACKIFSIHSLAVLWITMFMVSGIFNVGIVLATRLRYEGIAFAMGSVMQGFRYHQFVTLADAIPVGLFVLMALAVALFAASLTLSLRRRPAAFGTFCSAAGLSLGIWLYELGIPAYLQAMSTQHLWRNGICYVLTAGVLGAARFSAAIPRQPVQRLGAGRQ
jgi:hypothetical protein